MAKKIAKKLWSKLETVSQTEWIVTTLGSLAMTAFTYLSDQPAWLSIFVGLGTLALLLIIWRNIKDPLRVLFNGDDEPLIQAKAKLDEANGTRIIRIKLKNIGAVDVRLLAQSVKGARFQDARNDESGQLIPSGGNLTLRRSIVFDESPNVFIRLRLDLQVQGTKQIYTAKYAFDLEAGGYVSPSEWNIQAGASIGPDFRSGLVEALKKSETTTLIVPFMKLKPDGGVNDVVIKSGGKTFALYPEQRFVKFEGICNGTRKVIVAELPDNDAEAHIITLVWGPSVLRLGVNDNFYDDGAHVADLGTINVKGY